MQAAVRIFLHMIKADPAILPPAPAQNAWRYIDHRTQDDIHLCLRCGERAGCAYVADTRLGPRWLDLCWRCSSWMRNGLLEAEREEQAERCSALLSALDGL